MGRGERLSASPPSDRPVSSVLLDEVFGEEAWKDLRDGRSPGSDSDGDGDDDGDGDGDSGTRPACPAGSPASAAAAHSAADAVAGGYLADMVHPPLTAVGGVVLTRSCVVPRASPNRSGGGGVGGVDDALSGVPLEECLPLHVFEDEATYMAAVAPVTRLRILHAVGEAVWAEHDTTASHLPPGTVATLHASDLAVSPLGTDSAGNLWWYFGDGDRVYREPDVVAAAADARRAAVRAAAAAAAEREAAAAAAAAKAAAEAATGAKAAAAARKAARKGKGRRKVRCLEHAQRASRADGSLLCLSSVTFVLMCGHGWAVVDGLECSVD